jgi:hypothetical protein
MVWLLRIGMGALPRGHGERAVMAWDEIVITRELAARELDHAMRHIGDTMIEGSLRIARTIDPLLCDCGGRFDASYSALVRVFRGGQPIELRVGPGELECDNAGVAIAGARAGVVAGIARLRQLAGDAMTRQFSQERRIEAQG